MKFSKSYQRALPIIKIGTISSIGVFVKMLTSFVSAKMVAILLGAEGMALLGNFRNVVMSIQSTATLGLYQGVVKYVATYKNQPKLLQPYYSAILGLSALGTICTAIILLVYQDAFSLSIFRDSGYAVEFMLLALSVPFMAAYQLFLAWLNGNSQHRIYVIIQSLGQVISLLIGLVWIWNLGLKGAVLAVIVNPILLVGLSGCMYFFQSQKIQSNFRLVRFGFTELKGLGSYAIMAVLSTVILPIILLQIRLTLIDKAGMVQAGYWEAMQQLSSKYVLFVSSLLGLYVLPKFSQINNAIAFRREVFDFYKVVLPICIVGFGFIYIFRAPLILLLFSDAFAPMENIFMWYLSGDLFKIAALVLSYQLIAKNMFWSYILTEVLSLLLLYFASIYGIHALGLQGIAIVYLLYYVYYFILMLIVFRKSLGISRI